MQRNTDCTRKTLMRVTVIIPTYNQEAYIEQTIRSAMAQTYPNLEIIIGDDNSTDGTQQLIERIEQSDSRITYYRHKTNIGRVKNYHFLLHHSSGEWTINLDGDDYFSDPNFIANSIEAVKQLRDQSVNLIIAKYKHLVDGELRPNPSRFDSDARKTIVLNGFEDVLPHTETIGSGHLTSIYRTDLAKHIGCYEHDMLTADSESILRIALHGKVLFLNQHVAVWRKSSTNASHHSNIDEFLKAFLRNDLIRSECEKLKFEPTQYTPLIESLDIAHARRVLGRIVYERQEHQIPTFIATCKTRKISILKTFCATHMLVKWGKLSLRSPRLGFALLQASFRI